MKKFNNFKYNRIEEKSFNFEDLTIKEIRYIKDLKYGRKISLIEEFYDSDDTDPRITIAYYDKKSKKGKHEWYDLCGGLPLDESIRLLNTKINHWKFQDYINYIIK